MGTQRPICVAIYRGFAQEGIDLAYPTQTVTLEPEPASPLRLTGGMDDDKR